MDTPKRSCWHTAPRSALQNVSNGQSLAIRGSSSFNRYKTLTKEPRGVSASANRVNSSVRREVPQSHGDLSNLRPKTPPIPNSAASLHGLCLSPGNYVDDTKNLFSPNHNRQARQAIPTDWMADASGSRPPTITEESSPAAQQIHRSPLHSVHVSRLIDSEPVKISIQGIAWEHIQPPNFRVPVTRSYPANQDQRRDALHVDTVQSLAVEHINISTAWNGLSDVDAHELFRVHRVFVSTLEKMLANELWQIYQHHQQQDFAGNIIPIDTLFSAGIIRGISFCRDQLVSEMADILYSSKEDTAKAKSGFLRLYLVATDVLVQHYENSSRDTSITIRMRCDPLSPRPYPLVDAAWVADSLIFEGLDESPLEGQRFSVVPRYFSKSPFRPTQHPKNVKYSLESEPWHSSLSWLVWDDESAGFQGVVPFYSEVHGYGRHVPGNNRDSYKSVSHSLKIIVQAVLVDDNGSSIRCERILRARLTINVVPWYVSGNSRETDKRLSVPKAYQDASLVSAAQRFALQEPTESPSYPVRSLNRISQQSKKAHLYMPIKNIYTDQVAPRENHPVSSSSATGPGWKEPGLPSLSQTQAYLANRCAELKKELANVKEQILMSSPIASPIVEQHKRTLYVPDLPEAINYSHRLAVDHHTRLNEPTSQSSGPSIQHYVSKDVAIPSSPSLIGVDASLRLGPSARFPALPPPAIRPSTRPKVKDGIALNTARTDWGLCPGSGIVCQPAAPEDVITQPKHFPQVLSSDWRLLDQTAISSDDPNRSPSFPRPNVEAFSTTPSVKGASATISISGKHGRKRGARSSLGIISPIKCPEGTGRHPTQETGTRSAELGGKMSPISDSEHQANCSPSQWSGGSFYDPLGPLRIFTSSTTFASEGAPCSHASERDASASSSKNMKHCNQDSNCYMDTKDMDGDSMVKKTWKVNPVLKDDPTTAGSVLPSSFIPDGSEPVRLRQSSPATSLPRHFSTSSISSSRYTSSDTEVVVEQDPRARKVSRREQAKSWKILSRLNSTEENNAGPESGEVRLSADEKKAIDKAMQKSLDDLVDGFDDIFLQDSSESRSDDCEL